MHDANTYRTTGQLGVIKEMTLEELKVLDCGDGEKIPTLQELAELAKGKINLNCEIKVRGIANRVVEILQDADLIESTLISSFKHDELLRIQKLEPKLKLASLNPSRTGWIKSWFSRKEILKVATIHKFYAINPFYILVNNKFIHKAHEKNLKIYPWTVDSEFAIKKLVKMGVDGIITNKIYRVKSILNR
jgi:glycerophosphoryl diester phosphodiesterase